MKEIWRGWQGHFCCTCGWHLNTLIIHKKKRIIVSTVGQWVSPLEGKLGYGMEGKQGEDRWEEIGLDRKYETMVFESNYDEWDDADVTKEMFFEGGSYNSEKEAQEGHYKTLKKVKKYLKELK